MFPRLGQILQGSSYRKFMLACSNVMFVPIATVPLAIVSSSLDFYII